jgi:hypothetical protein
MSYSFNIRGATRAIAKALIAVELAAADAQVDLLQEDDSKDVTVYVSGSLGWTGQMEDGNYTSANVSVGAGLQPREQPAA